MEMSNNNMSDVLDTPTIMAGIAKRNAFSFSLRDNSA